MKTIKRAKPAPRAQTRRLERRRAPRRQPAMGTICQFAADGAVSGLGLVWNISTSGVSVLSPGHCDAGSMIDGELRTLDERAALPIRFQVAHVKELETGDYMLAGPFARSLSAAKIKPFVSMPPRSATRK